MKTKYLFTLLALAVAFLALPQQAFAAAKWGSSVESAQKTAEKEKKPILVLFTGTAWCGYCQKLEAELLKTKEFEKYVKEKYILVKFEYASMGGKAPKNAKKWQEKFKISGFPTGVIIDAEGKELGRMGYNNGKKPEDYIKQLKNYETKTEGKDASDKDASKGTK